jgi:hypothetical protein
VKEMNGQTDYIDLTPKSSGLAQSNARNVVFQETEEAQIRDNPGGLTKEGVIKKIELWSGGNNPQVLAKYQSMYHNCKNISKSGMKEDLIIYSRDEEGKPMWVESLHEKKQRLELEDYKKESKKK